MMAKSEINKVLGINIILSPSPFPFDSAPEGMYTREWKQLLHILLITACKIITISERNPQLPTVAHWKLNLSNVYEMGALTAELQLRSDVFGRRLLPIARYLSN